MDMIHEINITYYFVINNKKYVIFSLSIKSIICWILIGA